MKPKLGDLVRTPEGYYGIVSDMEEKRVFQGNGMDAYIDEADWERLAVMPLNIFNEGGVSNFLELINERTALRRILSEGLVREPAN